MKEKIKTIAVVIAIVLPLILVIPFFVFLSSVSGLGFLGPYLVFPIALIAFASIYLAKSRLGTASGTPETVLQDLAYRLRFAQYRVDQNTGRITVQVNSMLSLRMSARTVKGQTTIYYQPDMTPGGWSVLILVFLFGLGFVAVSVALFYAFKARRFAKDQVRPQLPRGGVPGPKTPEEDIRMKLVETLSEGRRLAAEAAEATQSSYEDWWVIIFVGVASVWLAMAVLLSWILPPIDIINKYVVAFIVATFATMAGSLPLIWHARRRFKPKIRDFNSWAIRLERALGRETARQLPPEPEGSAFELIAEACNQMPEWLEARREGVLFRDPGTSMVIFILVYVAFAIVMVGVVSIVGNPPLGIAIFAGALLLVVCSVVLYRRMWAHAREEMTRTNNDWKRRLDAMNSRMEKYLREL